MRSWEAATGGPSITVSAGRAKAVKGTRPDLVWPWPHWLKPRLWADSSWTKDRLSLTRNEVNPGLGNSDVVSKLFLTWLPLG